MLKRICVTVIATTLLYSCGTGNKKNTAGDTFTPPVIADSQAIFCLSMAANLPAGTYGDDDPVISANNIAARAAVAIDSTLLYASDTSNGQSLTLKNWHRVWGPSVAVTRSDLLFGTYVSSSSVTIFSNDSSNEYVVAIQATNPYSNTDWKKYDFNVATTIPWNSVINDSTTGVITKGTSLGLNSILSLQSNGTTAVAYIDTVLKRKNKRIIVTGHSLGGALSPVLALYMQHYLDSLNKANFAPYDTIFCMSTAGASPGDSVFTAFYNSKLGNTTVRTWNYFDLVPRAWNIALLSQAQSSPTQAGLYSSASGSILFDTPTHCGNPVVAVPFINRATPNDINKILNYAIEQSQSSNVTYQYICNNGASFGGASASASYLYMDTSTSYPVIRQVITLLSDSFNIILTDTGKLMLAQEGQQHVAAYQLHYNMKGVDEYMKYFMHKPGNYPVSDFYCRSIKPWTNSLNKKDHDPLSLMLGLIYLQAWK